MLTGDDVGGPPHQVSAWGVGFFFSRFFLRVLTVALVFASATLLTPPDCLCAYCVCWNYVHVLRLLRFHFFLFLITTMVAINIFFLFSIAHRAIICVCVVVELASSLLDVCVCDVCFVDCVFWRRMKVRRKGKATKQLSNRWHYTTRCHFRVNVSCCRRRAEVQFCKNVFII